MSVRDPHWNARVQRLWDEGFDRSYLDEQAEIKVRCPQCEALVVCGIPLHEDGCPNYRSQRLEGLFDTGDTNE